jgi:hypothetical protein
MQGCQDGNIAHKDKNIAKYDKPFGIHMGTSIAILADKTNIALSANSVND